MRTLNFRRSPALMFFAMVVGMAGLAGMFYGGERGTELLSLGFVLLMTSAVIWIAAFDAPLFDPKETDLARLRVLGGPASAWSSDQSRIA